MRYLLRLTLFCSVILSSCTQRDNSTLKYSIRDTVLKEYLLAIDSLPYYDESEINYKILKAYQSNDTTFLKKLSYLIRNKHYSSPLKDTCSHQQNLKDLGVDEAYRFEYFHAFCSMPINITVTIKGDSANLHLLLYQIKRNTYPCTCKDISEYDKKMSSKEWKEFNDKLLLADIWGLKRENGNFGLDGSTLIFIGYQRGNVSFNGLDNICYVRRWEYSTLHDTFKYLLKISGIKKGCYWIQ